MSVGAHASTWPVARPTSEPAAVAESFSALGFAVALGDARAALVDAAGKAMALGRTDDAATLMAMAEAVEEMGGE